MKNLRTIPFDIYLPATAESEARKVEIIEVEVYRKHGEDFLTADSSELVEQVTARHMENCVADGSLKI